MNIYNNYNWNYFKKKSKFEEWKDNFVSRFVIIKPFVALDAQKNPNVFFSLKPERFDYENIVVTFKNDYFVNQNHTNQESSLEAAINCSIHK